MAAARRLSMQPGICSAWGKGEEQEKALFNGPTIFPYKQTSEGSNAMGRARQGAGMCNS